MMRIWTVIAAALLLGSPALAKPLNTSGKPNTERTAKPARADHSKATDLRGNSRDRGHPPDAARN
jgi:hypothetical protein